MLAFECIVFFLVLFCSSVVGLANPPQQGPSVPQPRYSPQHVCGRPGTIKQSLGSKFLLQSQKISTKNWKACYSLCNIILECASFSYNRSKALCYTYRSDIEGMNFHHVQDSASTFWNMKSCFVLFARPAPSSSTTSLHTSKASTSSTSIKMTTTTTIKITMSKGSTFLTPTASTQELSSIISTSTSISSSTTMTTSSRSLPTVSSGTSSTSISMTTTSTSSLPSTTALPPSSSTSTKVQASTSSISSSPSLAFSTTKSATSNISSPAPSLMASSTAVPFCPATMPNGPLIYKSNATQAAVIGADFALYNSTDNQAPDFAIQPNGDGVVLFNASSSQLLVATALDGESFIYDTESSELTYIAEGCQSAMVFSGNPTPGLSTLGKRGRSRSQARQYGSPISQPLLGSITVQVQLNDQCGQPSPGYAASSLYCYKENYLETTDGSVPQLEQESGFTSVGEATLGREIASCSLDPWYNEVIQHNACVKEGNDHLDQLCGKYKDAADKTKEFAEKWAEAAKDYDVLSKARLLVLKGLAKIGPALGFLDKVCDDTYGLNNPYVRQELGNEDCGYPPDVVLVVDGYSAGQVFTTTLGTFPATQLTTAITYTTTTTPSDPTFTDAADVGTEHRILGMAEYCCTGDCYDGTNIFTPGICQSFSQLCGDTQNQPHCSLTAYLPWFGAQQNPYNTGDGKCWIQASDCQWQRNNWSYECRECPAGFISVNQGSCGPAPFYDNSGFSTVQPCVACLGPNEDLVGSPSEGYRCVGKCPGQ